MPKISRDKYTAEERKRYDAASVRLWEIAVVDDAEREQGAADFYRETAFRSALDEELAAGFPIDWPDDDGETLLHYAAGHPAAVHAGLLQILIGAGADLNIKTSIDHTPLGLACLYYIIFNLPEFLQAVDILLSAGARPELDGAWKIGRGVTAVQARRSRLETYITSWPERRARDRAADASPAFDYAL